MYIPAPAGPGVGKHRDLFRQSRIPRKAKRIVEEDESKPGYLCWGQLGAIPSSEPVPTTTLVVKETHHELSRETRAVRIENPDDPEQYVNALQTLKMRIQRLENQLADNSATQDADFEEWESADVVGFEANLSNEPKSSSYTITFKPPERAL